MYNILYIDTDILNKKSNRTDAVMLHKYDMTRNQINDTFLFQNRVKVKVVGC